ncbi:hypothetical protein QD712_06665 [Streptomyces acidiscabies]|uniref:hypothetical protein n=1 Tax=Streptomyces acidiscabies TaxID=42234 RepID=UPI0030CBB0FC
MLVSWLLAAAVCAALPLRRRHPVAGTGLYHAMSTVDGPLVVVPVAALYALAAGGGSASRSPWRR